MNDETLLSRLIPVTDEQAAALVSRRALSELGQEIIASEPPRPPARDRPRARPRPGTRRRRLLPLAVGVGLAAAAAVAIALAVSPGQPAPGTKIAQNTTPGATLRSAPASPPAPSHPSHPSHPSPPTHPSTLDAWTVTRNGDGTVRVTIREMDDPAGLQAKLRRAGVRVVVTASLASPAACAEWRGGDYRMGDRVLQNLNRTGLPAADGTEFVIRPSLIPAGALLWLGVSQTGKPNGVVGPPGPMGAGYLTATRACARS